MVSKQWDFREGDLLSVGILSLKLSVVFCGSPLVVWPDLSLCKI